MTYGELQIGDLIMYETNSSQWAELDNSSLIMSIKNGIGSTIGLINIKMFSSKTKSIVNTWFFADCIINENFVVRRQ
jgi:hypothetical protein